MTRSQERDQDRSQDRGQDRGQESGGKTVRQPIAVAVLAARFDDAVHRRRTWRRLLLLTPGAVALLVAAILIARQPRVYEAEGDLRLIRSALYRTQGHGAARLSKRAYQDEVEWLTSGSFERGVEARLPAIVAAQRPDLNPAELAARQRRKTASNVATLDVAAVPNTTILRMSAQSLRPARAAALVNAALDAAPRLRFDRETEQYNRTRVFVEARMSELERAIEAEQQTLEKLGRDAGLQELVVHRAAPLPVTALPVSRRAAKLARRLRSRQGFRFQPGTGERFDFETDPFDYQLNILSAGETRARLNAQLAEARLGLAAAVEAAGADVTGSPDEKPGSEAEFDRLRTRLAEARATYAALSQTLGPNAPQGATRAAEIAALEAEIAASRMRLRARLAATAALARAQQASLAAAVRRRQAELAAQHTRALDTTLLDIELAINLSLVEDLKAELASLRVNLAGGPISMEILDRPVTPPAPLPRAYRFYLVPAIRWAVLATLVLGLTLFLRDGRRWTVEELEACAGTEAGSIAGEETQSDRAASPSRGSALDALAATLERVERSRIAATGGRLLLLSSAIPGEGKTTSTLALARLLAGRGHRVLLLDCDLHRPTVHRRLRLDARIGLSTVLGGRASLSQAVQRVPGEDQIHALAAGPPPPRPSEMLPGAAMAALLAEARAGYDFILLDTPPLLALTDARTLAAQADEVLLVARWGRVTCAMVAHAASLCRQAGGAPAWLLVNGAPAAWLRTPLDA